MKISNFTSNVSLFLFVFTIGMFHSCLKDQDLIENPATPSNQTQLTNPNYPDEFVKTSIFGTVVDENEFPVIGCKVQLKTLHGFHP